MIASAFACVFLLGGASAELKRNKGGRGGGVGAGAGIAKGTCKLLL